MRCQDTATICLILAVAKEALGDSARSYGNQFPTYPEPYFLAATSSQSDRYLHAKLM
jgi:hypothetical protein